MSSRRFLRATFLVAGLALALTLATGSPAEAAFPQGKCFCGFWDFNADTAFGIPGIPYGDIIPDCFSITTGPQPQICSNSWGCGHFNITGSSGSKIDWDGQINGIPFFSGGKIEITEGKGDRRGPGSVLSGTTYTRDLFFIPAIRYNGTVEGAEFDPSSCFLP